MRLQCLYLVNNVLMNASANEFYSTGLLLLTFQDALSPMEQVSFSSMTDLHQNIYLHHPPVIHIRNKYNSRILLQVLRSPIALLAFLLILFLANQTTALTWSLGGGVVVNGFLKLDIPGWLHYATIRVIAVLPALYCVWSSGAEGIYQLLIFTQISTYKCRNKCQNLMFYILNHFFIKY